MYRIMDDFYLFRNFNILQVQAKRDCMDDKHSSIDGKLQGPQVSGLKS